MKEFLRLSIPAFIAPFALVWGAWLLTGFSFNVEEIFDGGWFWAVSTTWWVCVIPTIGIHIEIEAKKKKRAW